MPKWELKTVKERNLKLYMNNDRYLEYLESAEWKKKAKKRIEIDKGRCQMCGCRGTNFNKLHIHHLTYHNIFNEDPYTDLVCLCDICHQAVHRMMNRINDESGRRGWKDSLSYAQVTLNNNTDIEREI